MAAPGCARTVDTQPFLLPIKRHMHIARRADTLSRTPVYRAPHRYLISTRRARKPFPLFVICAADSDELSAVSTP
ncbi:hypothetical protein MBOT_38870 [Mycobacterium botniense]|uniref:Uncharacterized protein n=1 Tax=Mycobacterium botniense TaxID=84962 RepID=A0A7I9Y376_9MYCO|nr:hypothetical protein MBOT_38870 [Mycobacterium botniense]